MNAWRVAAQVCFGGLLLARLAAAGLAQEEPAKPGGASKEEAAAKDAAEPKPFQEVIKGATEHKGYLTVWQKEGKAWVEIPDDRLDKPFFFEANISNSIGERGAYASQMGASAMVVFHRIGNTMQLIARDAAHRAAPGTPAERAVRQSFSDSLIAS